MANYKVIIGNVGVVYSGEDPKIADAVYHNYEDDVQNSNGRMYGEQVSLLKDGVAIKGFLPIATESGRTVAAEIIT